MRILALLLLLSPITPVFAQQKPATGPETQTTSQTRRPSGEEVQALREDLDRMKALVQQMQSNLAFVDTTQSPLKHQFQLEIDMWRTVIASMERRLARSSQ